MLTDITVSVKELNKENVGERFNVKGAYVHRVGTPNFGLRGFHLCLFAAGDVQDS